VKLLLDTNVWLWSIGNRGRLTRRVLSLLESPRSELWLSSASAWELVLLADKGKLRLDISPERWIADALKLMPLHDAPITREVALESRRLAIATEDPADRFIAASARVYDLTLVTADERLLAVKGISTIANL
jgi:PIN domain nuclease of toxin-antitoxin system